MPWRALDVEQAGGERGAGRAAADERVGVGPRRRPGRPGRSRRRRSTAPRETGSGDLGDRDGRVDDLDEARRQSTSPICVGRAEERGPDALLRRRWRRRRRPPPGRGRRRWRRPRCDAVSGPFRSHQLVVVVVVVPCIGREDLATRVGPAGRAHAVRAARAVALRARVDRGRR